MPKQRGPSPERRTAYPVSDDERVVGFVTVDSVKRVLPDGRSRTLAREALRLQPDYPQAHGLLETLERMR